MNVILMTRTDRPSGALTACNIIKSSHNLIAIIAEDRMRMLTNKSSLPSVIYKSLFNQGIGFTITKIFEQLKINNRFLLRRIGLIHSKDIYLSINEFLLDHTVPHYAVDDHNSPETEKIIKDMSPDIIVLCNTRIIKNNIISIPSKGCINLHLGKLPEYRGMSSCFWEIFNREKQGGITVHFIDEKLDSGDIILEDKININDSDNEHSLYNKKLSIGPGMIVKALDQISDGCEKKITQDPKNAKMYHLPTINDYRDLKRRQY